MRLPTRRYRAAIVAMLSVAIAAAMAGIGIIAAEASPHAAAAPALIPCPIEIPIPGLCDSPSPSASASASATATASPTASATTTATTSPTVSSTLSVTPTVTATRTTSKPTPTPTSTPGTGAHKPLAAFSHQAATSKHPTRVVITITARGSAISKLTKVHLTDCKWSLGSAKPKHFSKKGRSKIRIVVDRKHESTVGHVRFHAITKAGNDRAVSARV